MTGWEGLFGGGNEPKALRWSGRGYGQGNGVLVDRPGRLYCARMVMQGVGQAQQIAILRDDVTATTTTGAIILVLDAANGSPDDWPKTPVSAAFLKGLKVEWVGTGSAAVLVGWDVD